MIRGIDINEKCSIEIEYITEGEEGTVVWDAGLVLLSYFNKNKKLVEQKNVLEIGAGTGVCGLGITHLGIKNLILTDRSSMINLLNKNKIRNSEKVENCDCSFNFKDNIDISVLDWNNEEDIDNHITKDIDIIIGSDCIYGNFCSPLPQLFKKFLTVHKNLIIYLSFEKRHRHNDEIKLNLNYSQSFFDTMKEDNNLDVTQIPPSEMGELSCDEISIWKISNKVCV